MPTYVYYDPDTGYEAEVVHGMTEDPIIKHPDTGKRLIRKITGGSGVIYKGEGWTGAAVVSKDKDYFVDKAKDEIRGGVRQDPYKKYRDEPL